jgi:hypothetical protein
LSLNLVCKINNLFRGKFMSSSNHSTEAAVQAAVINADEATSLVQGQAEAKESGCTPARVLTTAACTITVAACGAATGAGTGLGLAKLCNLGVPAALASDPVSCMTIGSIVGAISGGCLGFFAGEKRSAAVQRAAAQSEALQAPVTTATMTRN